MNPNNKALHNKGVSLWIDNITRKMLNDGTLKKYIEELSVTGLTSNPTIFDKAIDQSEDYDADIRESDPKLSDEELFFNLAIADIQRAADFFKPVYEGTNGLDGFVSIEVSPLLAYDTKKTIQAARDIFSRVNRHNTFIKIPGTKEGLPAIETAISEGIPINVTLLFSAEQYEAAAEAYLKGIEKRIEKGLNPDIRSVASVFVSRWDKAVADKVPEHLKNKLGLATSQKTYKSYLQFMVSNRVQTIMNYGASPQRLLWASTGTKDPDASDILYVKNLAAPYTVNTMPENTLLAFADHGETPETMATTTEKADELLKEFENAGVDISKLANQLQKEGADAFTDSWKHLMESIQMKREKVKEAM